MSLLLEHINYYFGTEYEDISQFIKDMRLGDLSEEYSNDEDKVEDLLDFLRSYNLALEGEK